MSERKWSDEAIQIVFRGTNAAMSGEVEGWAGEAAAEAFEFMQQYEELWPVLGIDVRLSGRVIHFAARDDRRNDDG